MARRGVIVGVVVIAVAIVVGAGIGSGRLGGSCGAAGGIKAADIICHSTSASAAAASTLIKASMVPPVSGLADFNAEETMKVPSRLGHSWKAFV